jgi:hypothetical protein
VNYRGLQGHLVALGFLQSYADTHKLNDKLLVIRNQLSIYTFGMCKRNKINSYNEMMRAEKYFHTLLDQDYSVSLLSFVFQLLIKNPSKDKLKVVTKLAMELSREHMFSKDDEIRNAKIIVNKFYNKGE